MQHFPDRESVEKSFDEKFGGITAHDAGQNWLPMYEQIKRFWRDASKARFAALRERVEGMKVYHHQDNFLAHGKSCEGCLVQHHKNVALSDISTLIRELEDSV